MSEFEKPSLIEGAFFHHYNYGEKGEQAEGIRRRIRQGIGGPSYLEPGADIHGHYHIGDGSQLSIGQQIEMDFQGQTWLVQLTTVHQPFDGMITQEGEDEIGYEVQATCIKRLR